MLSSEHLLVRAYCAFSITAMASSLAATLATAIFGSHVSASTTPLFKRQHADLAAHLAHAKSFADNPVIGMSKDEVSAAYESLWSLTCLSEAPDEPTLFDAVKHWALALLASPPLLEPLPLGSTYRLSAAQCRGILANALLGNCADVMCDSKHHKGGLDFSVQLASVLSSSVAAHKMAALMLYFGQALQEERAGSPDDKRIVTFERLACPSKEEMRSMLCGASNVRLLPPCATHGGDGGSDDFGADNPVLLHAGSMEAASAREPGCKGFVNFANADFGFGCFIPSATQEEILQACCPEFNVGMAFLGRMSEDEVINVYGEAIPPSAAPGQ